MNKRAVWVGVAVIGLVAVMAGAQQKTAPAVMPVRPAWLFTDHMVLQRELPVPVWGTADPGATVTVELVRPGPAAAGVTPAVSATADASGVWRATLAPLKAAAEPLELRMTSSSGGPAVVVSDVLVGEVWIGSGQSNMAFPLGKSTNGPADAAAAGDALLRYFPVSQAVSAAPLANGSGKWVVCTSNSAAGFSAVAYYFARDLRKALGVPVGVIRSAVGGTPAQAWTPRPTLESDPGLRDILTEYGRLMDAWDPVKADQEYREKVAAHTQAVARAQAAGQPPPTGPRRPIDPAASTARPSSLYNGMIAPLQPYAMRGVIWYQGENDSGRAERYTRLFPAMIASWRQAWGCEFPFLFVQIAPHNRMSPEIREAQLAAWRRVPRTAMVVTTDVGDAVDIHPIRKEPVGARLALAARAVAYGETVEYSGPLYESFAIRGGETVVSFSHAGGLKAADGGALKGFVVAGSNGVFSAAGAVVEGTSVVVRSPQVPAPVAVRYGWDSVPDCNLVNGAGLPASPFRTDAPPSAPAAK